MEKEKQGKIDSHTGLYGVFGDPIRHSRSPLMLNQAFQEAGINGVYTAFHVTSEQLKDAVAGIRALGLRGVNVTIPHKVDVMQYLDEIHEGAQFIGAVNTIVNDKDRLIGYNTDGIGYVRSLKEETGIELRGAKLLIIGAGGAARGIAYALAKEAPASITIVNRTKDKAEQLAAHLGPLVSARGMGMDELENSIGSVDLVVNTTSIGMHPNVDELPIPASILTAGMTASDIIYNPLTTRFLAEAKDRGCLIHGGLGMFVYQGAYAFEYWTGTAAPIAIMRETVLQSL